MDGIRINKYLSDAGICSRREADRAIGAGRVSINGHTAVTGERVAPHDEVIFDGRCVSAKKPDKKVIIAYNKPRGVVCTSDKREKKNIVKMIDYPVRIYPIGRLDKDSNGLILLTNDGSVVNKLLRARYYHEKEYEVTVDKPFDEDFVKKMGSGVPILDTVTRPCSVRKTGDKSFNIILTQGLNRQIRRMCEYLGYSVVTLKRIRIMTVELGDLKEGTYRKLTDEETEKLLAGCTGYNG